MNRDSKGRFKTQQKEDNDEPMNENRNIRLLDRPPTIKILFLVLLVLWVSSLASPRLRTEMDSLIISHYCPSNSTTTSQQTTRRDR
jgi:hypothetical protein